ncbi:MAG: restriction endonuclease subunit S, partial [Eubacterium sp.]|nr:restriction endonuclease subunit S [Eubacterium sp.]
LVYYAGFLICGHIKENYNPDFIFQNTLTESYNRFIRVTSQRSGQPGVNAQEYGNFSICTPSLEEQKKIGGYLRTTDNLITLHRRKSKICKFFAENDWLQRKLRNSWFRVIEAYRDKLILLKKVLKTILIVLKIIRITLFIAKEITEWLN